MRFLAAIIRLTGFCLFWLGNGALGGAVLIEVVTATKFKAGWGIVPLWYWVGCGVMILYGFCFLYLTRDNGRKENDNETS